ncbi:sulfhydrogenase subunit beta (sulfur reductase) [uncultured Gammaproteobacteria bacterium]
MSGEEPNQTENAVIDRDGLDVLIGLVVGDGYRVIGPKVADGAIILGEIDSVRALPAGWTDEQSGGRYRLVPGPNQALFGHTVGPYSWKRYLNPPEQTVWRGRRTDDGGFTIESGKAPATPYAFLGVRACDLHAIARQDKVFGLDPADHDRPEIHTDTGYAARRAAALIIALNCGRAGGTCFCASMNTGPRVEPTLSYDLALTELIGDGRHDFLVEANGPRGHALLARLPSRPVEVADAKAAEAAIARAAAGMGREMIPDVAALLRRNLDSRHWDEVGQRCLTCTNCTMVCPTCFCSTVEDTTSLDGGEAERTRKWDSCFSLDFTYIHGGSQRREARSRYRQWMTHKLSSWHDQFGASGCTGCGRCITWCPVGIDLTAEARAIRDKETQR